jgi:hypothetical protein
MSEFGASRREWMVTQAALAGHALDDVLPPPQREVPYRDYRGVVRPVREAVTQQSAKLLARDYDLLSTFDAPKTAS